ncbi:hypothetical protein FN846DRAFT_910615 [Sphaerosporella brunnea]|uniref:Uncharacterized protein n=1 Tax=Sphaerosporella brunnea TaxID=1250544 RepID=A0A5J5EN69_9PEZI|nr:hypothetical protein FN846DRAFT_910615 [Sphaerosporella brunnea]
MTGYLQTKRGQRLACTLGRTGITAAEFQEIAEYVRALCPIDLAVDPRSWTDFDDVEKEIYIDLLWQAVGKSEAKRRITKAAGASVHQHSGA